MREWIKLFMITLLLWGSAVVAQQSDIDRIKREIGELEDELEAQRHLEKTLLDQVEDGQRKLGLQKKLIAGLESERRSIDRHIRVATDSLNRTETSYQKLKDLVARRLVRMYKQGKYADWTIISSVSSLNKFLVWIKYQKKILDSDKRNLDLLSEKKMFIEKTRSQLEGDRRIKQSIIEERRFEEAKLQQDIEKHESSLAAVVQDRKAIQERLIKKRSAYNVIQSRLIRRSETAKPGSYAGMRTNFHQRKGKMIWPVSGKIVTRHGRQVNAQDKTYVVNRGIEIETNNNEAVVAVYDGMVLTTSWMRGMGNVIMLDHGNGYYTTYGQLEYVLVKEGMQVKEGDQLGQTGSRDGLYGSRLEFGLWKDGQDYNPEPWLK